MRIPAHRPWRRKGVIRRKRYWGFFVSAVLHCTSSCGNGYSVGCSWEMDSTGFQRKASMIGWTERIVDKAYFSVSGDILAGSSLFQYDLVRPDKTGLAESISGNGAENRAFRKGGMVIGRDRTDQPGT